MRLQVVIMAHEQGIAAFQRHERFWLMHNAPLMVVTPTGHNLKTQHEILAVNGAQQHGVESVKRAHAIFETLRKRDWDQCVIYEYDSFSLDAKLPAEAGFYGIMCHNAESPKFMAPRYANPPWCFDRTSFNLMDTKRLTYPALFEDGEVDRWMSALAFLAGVPVMDYTPRGFTRGTIESGDMLELERAIYKNTTILHGVKREWLLGAILQFYDQRNSEHAREIAIAK